MYRIIFLAGWLLMSYVVTAQAVDRIYLETTYSYVKAPSCFEYDKVKVGERYLLRSAETERVKVTEKFNDEGVYSLIRRSLTPEANRPGSMRAPSYTKVSRDGTYIYGDKGELSQSYPASKLETDMFTSYEELYSSSRKKAFPLTDLKAFEDFKNIKSNDGQVKVSKDGKVEIRTKDGYFEYNPSFPSIFKKHFDYELGHEVSSLYAYERLNENEGRLLYSVFKSFPVLSSGDTICRTTLILNDYDSKSFDEELGSRQVENNAGYVQVSTERSNAQFRWYPSEESKCESADVELYSVSGKREAVYSDLRPGEIVSIKSLSSGVYIMNYKSCNGYSSAKVYIQN